ncbi:hypothetical protein WR25_25502 [Diploscapter pachys]|uniref:Cadherin domain-containing protein n=1 Tax=Diploscapter pachys TaxID=2018661 RepID=A0A2A2LDA9_9BILA|nr:hypothetical protein WR25_25502 [Diploscapter pachys]
MDGIRQNKGPKFAYFLKVDDRSGEISTVALLDYEKRNQFHIIAIPIKGGGENREILVEVEDENDNSPVFPDDRIKLEISEFARVGSEYALPTAVDHDGPKFTVQKYRIAQGNVNNVFKITTRKLNDILTANLVVNGQLDREYRDKYELIIEAIDGGKPAKIGSLRVAIEILDANDNAPLFSQPRYTADVRANLSIGTTILTIKATDSDLGDNGKVRFRFQRISTPSTALFSLSSSGILSTAAHLEPGSVHDLVVTAYDAGQPSLEATAFVTVTVQGSSLSSSALDIIWLTETSTAHLLENVTLGGIAARIFMNDEHSNSELSLSGCPSLCLQQSDSRSVYLLLICGQFDRETHSEYHLKFMVKQHGEQIFEHPVLLTIGDVNDHAPSWGESRVHITLNRNVASPGKSLVATDLDAGMNGRIRYSILGTDAIGVDPDTGRIYPIRDLDCSYGNELRFKIRAEDGGKPGLSSDLEVIADLVDANTKPPVFEKGLYEVEVKEDTEKGTCLIKVRFIFV